MSLHHEAQADALTAEPARRGRVTPLSTRLSRILFSTSRWPWAILDLLVVLALYEVGIRLSPYGGYADVVSPYVALSVVYATAFVVTTLGLGAYDRDQRFDFFAAARAGLGATIAATLVNIAFHYFTLYEVVGRLTLVFGATCALVGVMTIRGLLAMSARSHPYRLSVIGRSQVIAEILAHWDHRPELARAYDLVGWNTIFADAQHPTVDELINANLAEVVVTSDAMSDQEAIDLALVALEANVPTISERTFYTHLFERVPLDHVSKRWILEQGIARPQGAVVSLKRLADLAIAGALAVILLPLFGLVALAVRLSGPGPILFIQTRQGRYLNPFRMVKFRTMHHEPDATSGGFTRERDARVTTVGRLLRRAHLDELPQLINIIRGDMSLVGPRPEALEFARRMNEEMPLYELRYLVRPGLTGHAQLKQGYAMDTALDTRIKLSYDLYYLCNYSMRLDLRILLRTALFLLRGSR